ncbi:uncharacterized protein NPIL_332181 [Nephila pilipes]|uniref:Uncharacterized protein n=1 Tax=Nephila pilipes TaxID=299642 RepID=A0A8X6NIK8_NEPPI|nr:uncharacterized protein NPIL_332181 [Nephila pilipes]
MTKNLTEIHIVLRDVCGQLTVDCSTISRWTHGFDESRASINDDVGSGRPKSSTDDLSVKSVADFPKSDRHAKYEEIPEATEISTTFVSSILKMVLKKKRNLCTRRILTA